MAWATKLVSKTHIGAQPADIVYASVVNSKGPLGEIKVSALKQYGLLEGDKKAYGATDLAKAIAASPAEELPALYARAALAPPIFKALFDTFHGDDVPIGRLKQRAAELNVHPDNTTTCANTYVAAISLAGLATVEGDRVVHEAATVGEASKLLEIAADELDNLTPNENHGQTNIEASEDSINPNNEQIGAGGNMRAVFHVNVNLDSSLDTEKLERQLALLKRFGAI